MAIPYALFARGLRDVPAAEAGLIGLLEPVLAPIWVALFHGELPTPATVVGGAILLAGVAVRYWPSRVEGGEGIRNRFAANRFLRPFFPSALHFAATAGGASKGALLQVGQRVVVDERRGLAREEVGVALHVEVVDLLDLAPARSSSPWRRRRACGPGRRPSGRGP